MRANTVWKRMLAEYEAPPIDEAKDEELREWIERKKASFPDSNCDRMTAGRLGFTAPSADTSSCPAVTWKVERMVLRLGRRRGCVLPEEQRAALRSLVAAPSSS